MVYLTKGQEASYVIRVLRNLGPDARMFKDATSWQAADAWDSVLFQRLVKLSAKLPALSTHPKKCWDRILEGGPVSLVILWSGTRLPKWLYTPALQFM